MASGADGAAVAALVREEGGAQMGMALAAVSTQAGLRCLQQAGLGEEVRHRVAEAMGVLPDTLK